MSERDRSAEALVVALTAAANAYAIYPPKHPQVVAALSKLRQIFDKALVAYGSDSFHILVIDGELVIQGEPWQRGAKTGSGLSRILTRAGVERLSLEVGLEDAELESLLRGLSARGELKSSSHLVVGRLALIEGGSESGFGAGKRSLEQRLDSVHRSLAGLEKDNTEGFSQLEQAVWQLIETTARQETTFALLASLRGEEDRLWRHSINVSLYASSLARSLGIEGGVLHDLTTAALLHDIGILSLPGDLGRRRRPLGDDERVLLRRHPELGAARLSSMEGVTALPVLVAYEHHWNANGKGGYPEQGRRPNLASQIVAVADTWDVLMDLGSALPQEERVHEAAQVLERRAGTILEPFLVSCFLQLVRNAS